MNWTNRSSLLSRTLFGFKIVKVTSVSFDELNWVLGYAGFITEIKKNAVWFP
jgi:hypothetical protein